MSARADQAKLHIGDVAECVGLSLRTVRYYEEQGLFEPAGAVARCGQLRDHLARAEEFARQLAAPASGAHR